MKKLSCLILIFCILLTGCAAPPEDTPIEADVPGESCGCGEETPPADEPEDIPKTIDSKLVDFFVTVLEDLWETDPGLNTDAEILAFDLTEAALLTQEEKTALVERFAAAHDAEGRLATFDELVEDGLIEDLYFENGLLFTLKITDSSAKKFSFDLTKWRSGLGAYFFSDCRAKYSLGAWSYTIGAEMIS